MLDSPKSVERQGKERHFKSFNCYNDLGISASAFLLSSYPDSQGKRNTSRLAQYQLTQHCVSVLNSRHRGLCTEYIGEISVSGHSCCSAVQPERFRGSQRTIELRTKATTASSEA